MAIAMIRTVILYAAIVVSLRVMGKRQIGELEPAELVVAVLISELAAHPLQDIGIPLLYGLMPVLALVCCQVIVSGFIVKSARFRVFVCGKPCMIIRDGQIVQSEMKKNRFTLDELAEQLRKKDVTDIGSVRYGILETDGKLSTVLYADRAPLTPRQMNISAGENGYPVIIINNGRVLDNNLSLRGYDRQWLQSQLAARNIARPSDVYLMSLDDSGQIYYALKDSAP